MAGLLLILSPMIFCFVFFSLMHPNPPSWRSDQTTMYIDTYVSSNDSIDHSSDTNINVSTVSNEGELSSAIGFIWFQIAVPTGFVGDLTDVELILHCSEIIHAGSVEIHKVQNEEIWNAYSTDLSDLNYSSMPSFNETPFSSIDVKSIGSYSISLHNEGGFYPYDCGGIALIAESGVSVLFSSKESNDESKRPLISQYGEGWGYINPILNPWICYYLPFSILPLIFGCILIGYAFHMRAEENIEI